MDKFWLILVLVLSPLVNGAWRSSSEDHRDTEYRKDPREVRRVHSHSKRHMLPDTAPEPRKRSTSMKPTRDIRKKPSGHLTPLEDDDMENDEVVSVAIGPPPLRTKYEKARKKQPSRQTTTPASTSPVGLVRNLLLQLSREFLAKDVDENFVFGQYLGNAMKNLTSEQRLNMQHEILEIIVKYQKNRDVKTEGDDNKGAHMVQLLKDSKVEKKFTGLNDTEENWPDFSNLAKIVGGK